MTTVELTIVSVVLTLVLAALFSAIVQMTTTTAYARERSAELDDIRLAADMFTKDARQGASVMAATATSFTFETYLNASLRTVTWRSVAATGSGVERFERVVDGATSASYEIDLTSTSVFDYFGASTPGAVTRVRLRLAAQPVGQQGDVAIEAEVDLRNVG